MGRQGGGKRRKQVKETAQPLDIYEAEAELPVEERPKNINKRYDVADGLEFELPSDVEDDEEIDEDMAFTEEDKIQFAGMFGDASDSGEEAEEDANLLDSGASDQEEGYNTDDPTEDDGAAGREAADGEDSDDDERHTAMLADIRGGDEAGRKRKRRDVVVSEAYPESEYNLNPVSATAGGEGQGELQLSDLIKGLGESRKKLGAARKTLERLERRGSAVAAPLPGNVQARQERKAAYEVTAQDVAKWQPMVKANREAPTLAFSAPRGVAGRAATTAALTAQFAPETDMEAEVAAMLQAAGVHSGKAVEEAEDALALKALSAEESKARRERLAKMRALLFYHERKAARMKAIKSKEYRRRTNKAARRKASKDGDGTGEALREAAEEAEFERAKERLTLKHKNTSKWARRALRRGVNVMDATTKEAMEEQLRLGLALRQRVEQPHGSDSGSDSDGSTSASDNDKADRDGGGGAAPGGEGAAGRGARKRAYGKSRAAALDVLQGAEEEAGGKGLFGLPFMKRAAEQQKAAAAADAAVLLRSIESEVTGVPEDELQQEGEPQAASGRFAFGAGQGFGQNGATAGADSSSDDSDAGEHEDAEAKAERLAQRRRQDAATASQFGAGPLAAELPSDRHDGGAQPGRDAASGRGTSAVADAGAAAAAPAGRQMRQATSSAAQLSHGARNSRLFGGSGAGNGATAGTQQQPDGGGGGRPGGVSIGPASQVTTGSMAAPDAAPSADGPTGRRQSGIQLAALAAAGTRAADQPAAQPAASSDDEGSGGEAAAPDAMRPVPDGELSQRELIAMAFAGDDVAADFAAQKAEEAEEEAPPAEAATMLPGWGSWASAKRMQRDADAAAKKAQQQKEAALARRKDAGQAHVVISEKWDRRSQKYAATTVPFPFDGRDTYERSLRQPLGQDFNTNASFRNLTRPAITKEVGLLIKPLKYSKGASDKTAGSGFRGAKLEKGAGPSKSRPRVKVVAGGQPRN